VVDGGRCEGLPSTVVGWVGSELEVLRHGSLTVDDLAAVLHPR
jgi:tRNA A37 threonylcarbamoyladenosine synthetase subunit TsaC/SUA5/YrdC